MATDQEKPSSNNKNLRLSLSLSFLNRKSSKSNLTSPRSHSSSGKTVTDDNEVVAKKDHSEELRQVFRRFDTDGDGKISAYELRQFFGSIGEYVSHDQIQAAIDEVDRDGDGLAGFDDFFDLMTRRDLDGDGDCGEGDLKTAFEMFELEKGSGCITPKGLQKMLEKLGEERSYGECEAMISVYDTDGNGVLDFHEFRQMMTA